MSAASLLSGGDSVAPAETSNLSVVQQQTEAAATKTWIDQIPDPEVKNYATAKGFKEPGDVVNMYRNLEKLLGGEKIPMPKGEQDVEGWNRMYKAIGRPETPEGYKLPSPETGDKGFIEQAAKVFHQAGLSNRQASALTEWYQKYGSTVQQAQQEAIARRNSQELETFKTEQGQLFDAKLELGRRAAKQFGFSNDELLAFENAFGTKTLLTRFAAIGEAMGEHVVTGTGDQGFGMSATGAQATIAELKKDKEFTAKYLSGDMDAKNRMMALQAAANGMTLEDYRNTLSGPATGR